MCRSQSLQVYQRRINFLGGISKDMLLVVFRRSKFYIHTQSWYPYIDFTLFVVLLHPVTFSRPNFFVHNRRMDSFVDKVHGEKNPR